MINIKFDASFTFEEREKIEDMCKKTFHICQTQFSEDISISECHFFIEKDGYGGEGKYEGIRVNISDVFSSSSENLIHHELVHFFQARLLGKENQYKLPQWFSEGMAVAYSGQNIPRRKQFIPGLKEEFGVISNSFDFILMDDYIKFDFNKEPFDALYGIWGSMFIYTVCLSPSINANYDEFDGPYFSEEEYLLSKGIIKDSLTNDFEKLLEISCSNSPLKNNNLWEKLQSFLL